MCVFFSILCLCGCAPEDPPKGKDELLAGDVAEFYELCKNWNRYCAPVNSYRVVDDLPQGVVGKCYRNSNGRWIEISSKRLGTLSEMGASDAQIEAEIEFNVFHELGHCAMDQGHRGGLSYMNDDLSIFSIDYPAVRTQMVEELFSH